MMIFFKLKKEDLFTDPNDQIVLLENIRFYQQEEKMNLLSLNIWLNLLTYLLMMLFHALIEHIRQFVKLQSFFHHLQDCNLKQRLTHSKK